MSLRHRTALFIQLLLSQSLAADVVINEFLPNPDGTDAGYEWVELYNSGPGTVDISSWKIETATSSWSVRFTVPGSTMIGAGSFLVIGDASVAGADLVLSSGSLQLGNAATSGDGVRLLDSGDSVIDTVIYGPNNSDEFLDDTGLVAVNLASTAPSGQSIARTTDGVDTNDSSADFQVGTPTLGGPNSSDPLVFEDGFETP